MKFTKIISNFDYIMFFSALLLAIIGLFFIYSSVLNTSQDIQAKFMKQLVFFIVSFIILISLFFVPTRSFKDFALHFYIFCMLGLLLTLFLYEEIKGQKRFSLFGFSFQFSELMKIAVILMLAKYYSQKTKKDIEKISTYFKGILIAVIPVLLIFIQPDLGTLLVYIPILLGISFFAGIPVKYLVFTIIFLISVTVIPIITTVNEFFFNNLSNTLSLFTTTIYVIIMFISFLVILGISLSTYFNLIPVSEKFKKIFYWIAFYISAITAGLFLSYFANYYVLSQYQKDRLLIFLNPEFDAEKKGYNIIQSKTTIGNGGIFGRGWCKGEQTQKKFLPEQETDFIFPVIAEERGFIGSLIILFLYSLIFYRGFKIILKSRYYYETYIVVGILSMFLFHIFQNIGMCIGIMPITGIPLPFLSYGGSFLITCFIGIGIMMNIRFNRYRY